MLPLSLHHLSTMFPLSFHHVSAIFPLSIQYPKEIVFIALGLDKDMVNRGIIKELKARCRNEFGMTSIYYRRKE